MKIKEFAIPLTVVGMFAVGTAAWAGTSFENYSTTVGRFNGSGYTAYQTKSGPGTAAELRNTRIGGGYHMDARLQAGQGTGPWRRVTNFNGTYQLFNHVPSGQRVACISATT